MAQPIRGLILDWFREINRSFLSGHTAIMLPKCELDEEYPHKCFKCLKPLEFKELIIANSETDEEYLEKLWKTEAVEFYCCDCYRKEKFNKEWSDRLDCWSISLAELQEYLSRRIEQDREMAARMQCIRTDVDVENLEFGYDIAEE